MNYIGADLHKNSITFCVFTKIGDQPKFEKRRYIKCSEISEIREFFEQHQPFELAVEATSSYEWLLLLADDVARRCVLVHPKKLRIIAESTRKSDKVDARVLGEFLARDMLPEAWRPTPRVREHRVLVRHRCDLQKLITACKNKIRHKLANYNADIAHLFTEKGQQHLAEVALHDADRFEVQHLQAMLNLYQEQLKEVDAKLLEFARHAPAAEREARAVLETIPQVGQVTIDCVLSELGDVRRFRGAKKVVSYAGLDPCFRESDNKRKNLSISKEGSRIMRWALLQAAWRLVGTYSRWSSIYKKLQQNTGSKRKAIVGVARRLLCVMYAMLRDGKGYRMAAAG